MTQLHFRRLDPASPHDLLDWQRVFRGAQSFTFATQGRPPTDADAQRMMRTLPAGRSQDDMHLFAIDVNGTLCGIAFLMRGYPAADVTYVVALVLMEEFQNRSLGAACLERIEGLARSWQARKLSAVVDSANVRGLAFWRRHGFREVERRELPDLVGQAICIDKPLDSRPGIDLREEPVTEIAGHAAIPSVCESGSVFDVLQAGGGYELRERLLVEPHRKDYDLLEDPRQWPARFDVSNWALIGTYEGGTRVGGAIAAFDTPGVDMLEGRKDLVVLWDLRVSPGARRRGLGAALLQGVEAWGRQRQCRELKVETQNTNVAACRLYARQGCTLRQANRGAYPELPDEVQLIWRKALGG
jgi:ribosomal protein S18 acetylase RimI-like enzyme